MYEQTRLSSMRVGEVYRCPPGGQVVLVVDNVNHGRGGHVTFLVLEAGIDVNFRGKGGTTVQVPYTYWAAGSWTRVS